MIVYALLRTSRVLSFSSTTTLALVARHQPKVLVLDISRVFDIEYSALQMLMEGERRITDKGVTFWMAGLNPSVLEYVRSSGFADQLGKERLFFNTRAVIRYYTGNRYQF